MNVYEKQIMAIFNVNQQTAKCIIQDSSEIVDFSTCSTYDMINAFYESAEKFGVKTYA